MSLLLLTYMGGVFDATFTWIQDRILQNFAKPFIEDLEMCWNPSTFSCSLNVGYITTLQNSIEPYRHLPHQIPCRICSCVCPITHITPTETLIRRVSKPLFTIFYLIKEAISKSCIWGGGIPPPKYRF